MFHSVLFVVIVGCTSPDGLKAEESGEADSGPGAIPDAGDSSADTGERDSGEDTSVAPASPWRSALYPTDWHPGFAVGEAQLHDFSYAGYRAGEAPLPTVSATGAVSVLDHGADPTGVDDSTTAIQGAIDAAAAAGGGVVHLPAGTYRIDGLLRVETSGVVLLGDGPTQTFLGFTRADGMTDANHLSFAGAVVTGDVLPLVADTTPMSFEIAVADPGDLAPGDRVSLGWTITEAFISDHSMEGYWTFSAGEWRPFFRRTVTAVDPDSSPPTVTLDVPIRYTGTVRDGVGIRRETGQLTACGVQSLAVSTAVDWAGAWGNDRSHAISFDGVEDCWMRDVHSWAGPAGDGAYHLQSGGVIVSRSRRVTIADTTLEHAQNRGGGGNGYLFELRQSGEVLIRDAVGRAGRHNFIQNWDFGTSGCVFLRTFSEDGQAFADAETTYGTRGSSEYHHALAMANLVDDSVAHDGWKAVNRLEFSSGAGHTSTANVFWNTRGDGILYSYQWGLGYVIGTEGLLVDTAVTELFETIGTAPEDWVEGIDAGALLEPRSLYEDQLARRMGR